MPNHLSTRAMTRADLPSVAAILDATGLFPSELLPDMAEPFLDSSAGHSWRVVCNGEDILGFAYAEPERMTDNTHNLLAIAVVPNAQNQGVGGHLVRAIEQDLRERGGRVLIVETSSLDDYDKTRSFYDGLGFTREAVIHDFYSAGESKIIFWKQL